MKSYRLIQGVAYFSIAGLAYSQIVPTVDPKKKSVEDERTRVHIESTIKGFLKHVNEMWPTCMHQDAPPIQAIDELFTRLNVMKTVSEAFSQPHISFLEPICLTYTSVLPCFYTDQYILSENDWNYLHRYGIPGITDITLSHIILNYFESIFGKDTSKAPEKTTEKKVDKGPMK